MWFQRNKKTKKIKQQCRLFQSVCMAVMFSIHIAKKQYHIVLGLIIFAFMKVDLKYSNSNLTVRTSHDTIYKLVLTVIVHSSQQGLGILQICSFSPLCTLLFTSNFFIY